MGSYKYSCTGYIDMAGFGAFLEEECIKSRVNLVKFSEELHERFGFPHVALVNSGSSANLVGALAMAEKVRAAGLPMVAAISAFTFPTTVSALCLAGFEVRMVDVDEGSFNLSCDALERLAGQIGVAVPTHFLGFPCDIARISDMAHRDGFFVMQDACETMEMKVEGKGVFAFADITTLSFYHPHHLSSYGGGAVVTRTQADYLLVDSIAHWGRSCKCHVDSGLCTVPDGPAHQFTYERLGLNVEMSELNACFGRWQLKKWGDMEAARKRNYAILYRELRDNPRLRVWPAPDTQGSAFVFPVQLRNGMTVADAWEILGKEGIEIRTLMGGVSNEQAAFTDVLASDEQKNAHRMAETTFFVGIHQTLPPENVKHVAGEIIRLI